MQAYSETAAVPSGVIRPTFSRRANTWLGNAGLVLCLAFLGLVLFWVVTGSWSAPLSPTAQAPVERLMAPMSETSRGTHWMGTDQLGRDLFSTVISATRLTLFIAAAATAIGLVLGTALGMMAGYFGGWPDRIVMRLTEAQIALPNFLIAIFFLVMFGPSVINLIIVLPMFAWPIFARVIRAETLRIRELLYIEAAVATGSSSWGIIWYHILPNVMPRVLVLAVVEVGHLMLAEAGLSFIGMGVQPPDITWGLLIARGRPYLSVAWWLAILPGVMLALTVLVLNLLSRRYAAEAGTAG